MSLCEPDKCSAKCCLYVAQVIGTPRSRDDFDDIRWFVAHDNVFVYKDSEDDWVLEFMSPCKYLADNRCTMYERRPNICRKYDPAECTKDSDREEQKIRFTCPEDVDKFVNERWNKNLKKKTSIRKP